MLADGPACTCHLVEDTGAKQPTVSHHLRVLREAGVVVAEPRGRFTYYRLLPDAFAGIAPASAPGFVLAQFAGLLVAVAAIT